MSKKILRLPQSVIDSIAAGEVLERPANLVKELVENSLDAGATEIEVDVADGGKTIRVTDNGQGMESEDLAAALERHATSKIKTYDDLWKLGTFGFRGEALASIAAVSRMTVVSRTKTSQNAHRIQSEFGTITGPDRVAGIEGTTIQIESLFENVPARLKFLKTDAAELGNIRKVMKAMALSVPGVTFKMKHRGELIHFWHSVDSHGLRAEQVLERHPMFASEGDSKNIKVHVTFAAPDKGQRTGQNIWLFAQGRWIQDKALFAAVMDSYRSLLMHGEFPSVVVKVECAPGDIDVNVHPTKAQVKFRDGQGVYRLLQHTLRQALEQAPWAPKVVSSGERSSSVPSVSYEGAEPIQETFAGAARNSEVAVRSSFSEISEQKSRGGGEISGHEALERTVFKQKTNFIKPTRVTIDDLRSARDSVVVRDQQETYGVTPFWGGLQILGQANLTYIVAQTRQGLVVVDQHAAHERIAYERLMSAWRDEKGAHIEVQPYLLPLTLEMQPEEVEALMSVQDDFEKLHLSLDQGGPASVIVRATPSILKERAIRSGLSKVASEMVTNEGSFAFERMIGDLCATLACHSVIRAGQALAPDEMKALLVQMDEFPLSGFCPHGRPVYIEYSFNQMDRQFGRIV